MKALRRYVSAGILVLIALTVYSCRKGSDSELDKTEKVSVTVEAIAYPDGTVVTETDVALDPKTKRFFGEMEKLEEQYPRMQPPSDATLYNVSKVISGDLILLDDDTVVKLAGVKCPHESDPEYNDYFIKIHKIPANQVQKYAKLSRIYVERFLEGGKVAFIQQSKTNGGVIVAYLWTVDFSLMNDPEMKGLITGPSYSCMNESILTSGWGVADLDLKHSYADKYIKLQKLARENKRGLWE